MTFWRSSWTFAIVAMFVVTAASRAQDAPSAYTFNKDVAPILQKHCAECHHAGGTAPQAFDTYKDMKPWIRSTMKTVREKTMPPWHADPAVGQWRNDARLTDEESKILIEWAKGKGPEGAGAAPAPAVDYSKPWRLGEPGKTLQMAEPYAVPAQGGDIYRAFVLTPEFAADTWVESIELAPGAVAAVQQLSLTAAPAAEAKAADDADSGPGFKAFDNAWTKTGKTGLAFWTRGPNRFEPFPAGKGVLIPKGSSLVLLAHYRTTGDELKDQSKVGLRLGKPGVEIKTLEVTHRSFTVPAAAYEHKVTAEAKLEKAVKILAIRPETHYLGRKIELIAHKPDGTSAPLLKIDDYSYDLQTVYTAKEPIALPAGTRLEAVATYENTKDNPANPNMTIADAAYGPAPAGEALSVAIQFVEE